jgi:hypothetical protein
LLGNTAILIADKTREPSDEQERAMIVARKFPGCIDVLRETCSENMYSALLKFTKNVWD